eukprot:778766-Pyramimonas_sp.AAC.1
MAAGVHDCGHGRWQARHVQRGAVRGSVQPGSAGVGAQPARAGLHHARGHPGHHPGRRAAGLRRVGELLVILGTCGRARPAGPGADPAPGGSGSRPRGGHAHRPAGGAQPLH